MTVSQRVGIEMVKPKINKAIFGERLKALMDAAQENTYSMGRTFNLSPPSISRYTRGEMAPKITTIQQMAAYFDVNPQWLMGEPVNRYESEIILEDTVSADAYSEVAVFDCIRYDIPLFSNARTGESLRLPVEKVATWGAVFAFQIPDDSMAPTLQQGAQAIIRLDTTLKPGTAMALHINRENLIIRKVVVQDDYVILQPHNPDYDARCCHIKRDDIHIIGEVVYIQHCLEKYF